MLDELFGNSTASKALLFLARYGEGYPTEIAGNFSFPVSMVQLQLEKLERAGVLVSRLKGRTRLYTWNPRYPFRDELLALLCKAFDFMPDDILATYYKKRTRPRRAGKPL
ncbi:MAG: winged helix-turn-helix domain-containing protein [Candidatus Wallbacteria bacterium]|nr:winged helix-turn-helix domain-containing protein [Candidatus Wallbacteria bacterium]